MISSTITAYIPCDSRRVWDALTDAEAYPRWRSGVSRTELTPDGFIEYAPDGFATRFTVTQRREGALWSFSMENSRLTGSWQGELRPEGRGTRASFTELVKPRNPFLLPFIRPYLRRQQRQFVRCLCAYLAPARD